MKEFLKKILEDNNGNQSSKRLSGILAMAFGLLTKLSLFYYNLFFSSDKSFRIFDKLDDCANSLLYIGTTLLGFGLIELFSRKKNVK